MAESDFKAALDGAQADRDLLLAALVKRVIYPFAPGENPQAFIALVDGSLPYAVATEGGGIFFLAVGDLSAHDGVTVIVTSDGYRYLTSNMTMPDAVDGIDVDEPVGDEEIGAAYITSSAPTGDFASWPDMLVVLTIRDWLPIEPRVGRPVYVKGVGHYFLHENGDWRNVFLPNGGQVRDEALVGGQRRYIVQSQTLNTPPGSPGVGVYWIIGPSPTGAWAGFPGYIATKYDGDAVWTLIAPKVGDEAFDIANFANYVWTGTTWTSAAGAWNRILHYYTAGSGSAAVVVGTVWNGASAPTTSTARFADAVTITIQALTGKKIRFTYKAQIAVSNTDGGVAQLGVALYRDGDATSIRWVSRFRNINGSFETIEASFIWTTDDAASHEYKISVIHYPVTTPGVPASVITAMTLRDFMAEVAT